MRNALVGYTGFIGKNLMSQIKFDCFYNSKNINDIRNQEFDMVISSANSSLKWLANKNHIEDRDNILSFIENIKCIKTKKFILLSTIDVYETAIGVNEDNKPDCTEKKPYGLNRLILEQFVQDFFEDYLIIRLPIVYGDGLKKNIIFDILNNNQIDKINGNSKIQIYNVHNLKSDINRFIEKNIKVVNLATEPLLVSDLFKDVFDINLKKLTEEVVETNMMTNKNIDKYFYKRDYLISELSKFKREYGVKCI
jgi:nucleoside-diphosphate-sugar epimerase